MIIANRLTERDAPAARWWRRTPTMPWTSGSASRTAARRPGRSTTAARRNPYADFNGSGTLTERYLFGPGVVNGALWTEILARTSSGGTTAWYLTDKLGSVRDIVSSSGTELDHIVYDSFGNIVTETNASNGDRFKFAGMEYDSVTGQYYDRARYYLSSIGRFIELDPMGFAAGDRDLYRYVGNQPTRLVDPTGLEEQQTAPRQQDPTKQEIPPYPENYWDMYQYFLAQQAKNEMLEKRKNTEPFFQDPDLKDYPEPKPIILYNMRAQRAAQNAQLLLRKYWQSLHYDSGGFPSPPGPTGPIVT